MANQIQGTVYQIDGNPQKTPIIVSFLTSNIQIKEASISTIPEVNSAITCYQNASNQLQEQTFYVSDLIDDLVLAANVGNASQVLVTVLEIDGDPQIPGGIKYSFPASAITIFEISTSNIGANSSIGFKNKQYSVYETEASIAAAANVTSAGAQGPQGIQGPAGPIGPVGPAGLNWQGLWVSGNSYVEDDAVGFNGASWFCILATSGTTSPSLDTTHWALLAAQGAQGIQGAQGPTGPQGAQGIQGPAGVVPFSYENLLVDGDANNPTPITAIYTNTIAGGIGNWVSLPDTPTIGDTYYIANKSSSLDLYITSNSNIIFLAGSNTNTNDFHAGKQTNTIYVFQYSASGLWNMWKLSSAPTPYTVYSALVSYTAGAPSVTVLQNTTGATITWAKASFGGYFTATASSAIFTSKTTFSANPYIGTYMYNNVGIKQSTSLFNVISMKTSDFSISSENNIPFFVEIRIYN
jgi:hypothetical protein